MRYQNIGSMFYSFVIKNARDEQTDRQTDWQAEGENYDPQDRASIAALRGKNQQGLRQAQWLLARSEKVALLVI